MKTSSLTRIALLGCTLATAGFTSLAFAQDTNTAPTDAPKTCTPHHHHHDGGVLTSDEQAQLKKDREQVFANDPDLKAEGEQLHTEGKSLKDSNASKEDKKAFFEKAKAFHNKVDEAIVKLDPTAAPLIAKIKAAHPHHHHDAAPADNGNQ